MVGAAYRRTYDLQELHDLLVDAGTTPPPEVVELVEWSPFAVVYRYEDWSEPEQVNRAQAVALVVAALAWARGLIEPAAEGPGPA